MIYLFSIKKKEYFKLVESCTLWLILMSVLQGGFTGVKCRVMERREKTRLIEAYIEEPIKKCEWELIKKKVDALLREIIQKSSTTKTVYIYVGRSSNPCRREKKHIRSANLGAKWLRVLCCSDNFEKIKDLEKKLILYVGDKIDKRNNIKLVNREKGGGSKGQPPYWLYIGLSENLFNDPHNCEKVLKLKRQECLSKLQKIR